ncbi:MFS transporter [Ovoidimarina sediminis]|uniref:MFS transporter n=1 Tax=Ovoidimarina sediminis TaxID=3079856 RepID=UPI002908C2BD|nr:MFS transporter [Rhodophyticola sp. MJ-SS7]MDU8941965.1 MFS transporter [Rhodophyticola sp. MJ-SS7]
MEDTPADNRRAYRNIAVLVAAQAILGSQITMSFVAGGLVGQILTPNPCLATLPITMIVLGSMSTAPWLSRVMQRWGRRAGFLAGASGGLLGSLVAVTAIGMESFGLFLLGSYLTGIYMSAQGFYRFAATDTASADLKPKAISYVLAGGLVAAILGPQLVSTLTAGQAAATAERFMPVYYAAMTINFLGMGLFFLLDIPRVPPPAPGSDTGRSVRALITTPAIAVAVICGAVSYALMNLVMTSTPLAVVGCGYAVADAANVVSAHVLAMFLPSFFTGHLIARFGARTIVATGLVILAGSGLVALQGVELGHFFGALILLGFGWNFGFIGATALLTELHSPQERGRVQGMNDMIVFGSVSFASLMSGGLLNCTGSTTPAGWAAVNMAMIPFLVLAGAALIWLSLRPQAPERRPG